MKKKKILRAHLGIHLKIIVKTFGGREEGITHLSKIIWLLRLKLFHLVSLSQLALGLYTAPASCMVVQELYQGLTGQEIRPSVNSLKEGCHTEDYLVLCCCI